MQCSQCFEYFGRGKIGDEVAIPFSNELEFIYDAPITMVPRESEISGLQKVYGAAVESWILGIQGAKTWNSDGHWKDAMLSILASKAL